MVEQCIRVNGKLAGRSRSASTMTVELGKSEIDQRRRGNYSISKEAKLCESS